MIVELRRINAPLVASLAFTFFLNTIWLDKAATQFMSEHLGVIASVAGSAILCRGLTDRKSKYCLVGVFLISLAQVARPGNPIIPVALAVLVWSFFQFTKSSLLSVAASLTLPYLLVIVFGIIKRYEGFGDFGNSWSPLYGISAGNRDWSVVYSDFAGRYQTEKQLWELAKNQSIENIISSPIEFISYIIQNFLSYFNSLITFSIRKELSTENSTMILCTALLIFLFNIRLILFRLPIFIFLNLILISEVFFIGVIYKSDPIRTLSSGFAPLFVGTILLWSIRKARPTLKLKMSANSIVPLILFSIVLLSIMSFATVPRKTFNSEKCDKEFSFFSVLRQTTTSEIALNDDYSWWQNAISALPKGTFIQGFSQINGDIIYQQYYLPKEITPADSFCIKENNDFGVDMTNEEIRVRQKLDIIKYTLISDLRRPIPFS
jgi:hypothetical protein